MTTDTPGSDSDDSAIDESKPEQGGLRGLFVRLSRLLCISIVVVTLATLVARSHWLADLLANLRMQQVIAYSVSLILVLALRQLRISAIIGACLALHLIVMLPQVIPGHPEIAKDSKSLRLMTFNVLTSNQSHAAIVNEIQDVSPDVFVILELSSSLQKRLRDELSATWPYRVERSEDGGNFGIGMYSKFELEGVDVFRSREGLASIAATCQGIHMIATHPLPPMGKQGFESRNSHLEMIADRVNSRREKAPSESIVVMGDFNLTPWSPHFTAFEKRSGLRRAKEGVGIRPTWYASGAWFHYGLVLDHVMIDPSLGCDDYRVGAACGSDHRSVSVRVGKSDRD